MKLKANKVGRIEMMLIMVLVFLIVFVGVDKLAGYFGSGGFGTHGNANKAGGTGWMQHMEALTMRAYNGVVRPVRGVKTPTLGQDDPGVFPVQPIAGSAPTTPEPIRPFPTYQGW